MNAILANRPRNEQGAAWPRPGAHSSQPACGRPAVSWWGWSLLLVMAAAGLLFWVAGPAWAATPIRMVAQMTIDDDGRPLNYPSAVFYDAVQEEIYLVNGGSGRVVIYGPDYFPLVSVGAGRGVEAPRGGLVLENGQVYLCQVRNVKSARPRITILNGALFVEREIYLDDIPAAADFIPRSLAISQEGLLYLAGRESRGVLVLDSEGNFLRRLRPLDQTRMAVEEDELPGGEAPGEQPDSAGGVAEAEGEADPALQAADIPEEFRPRTGRQAGDAGRSDGQNPVRINHVSIGANGRLYLLSAETSKVYVYGADESFLFAFGEKGGTPRRLSTPKSLAVDEKRGLIYVADYMRHSILVYNLEGIYLFEFGGRGGGPGWFNFPEDIALDNQGRLIVADLFNRRVQVLEVEYEELSPARKPRPEPAADAVVPPPAVTEPFVEIIGPATGQDQVPEEPADGTPEPTEGTPEPTEGTPEPTEGIPAPTEGLPAPAGAEAPAEEQFDGSVWEVLIEETIITEEELF